MSRAPLSDADLASHLASLPHWTVQEGELVRLVRFSTYMDGIAFVCAVAGRAEAVDHHPDLEVSWGKVKIRLSTHDPKGISALDMALALEIEGLTGTAQPEETT